MMYSIFAICGSTRNGSTNELLIRAISTRYNTSFVFDIFTELAGIPAFNPAVADANMPDTVVQFKQRISSADAVLICTPEYAHGVPGALKNAIDWTVGSGEFSGKPTALITASTDGRFGHAALLEVLKVLECPDMDRLQLLVQFIKTKVNAVPEITDDPTQKAIAILMDELYTTIKNRPAY